MPARKQAPNQRHHENTAPYKRYRCRECSGSLCVTCGGGWTAYQHSDNLKIKDLRDVGCIALGAERSDKGAGGRIERSVDHVGVVRSVDPAGVWNDR